MRPQLDQSCITCLSCSRRVLLPAWQVAGGVTARQQHLRNGLCAGLTGLIAQLAARVAAGLQLMGARLQALQSQMSRVIRMAQSAGTLTVR